VSRQLEAVSIRRLTPRRQQEDGRTNGRRGVSEKLGRLDDERKREP
jgi:hypothetical protein